MRTKTLCDETKLNSSGSNSLKTSVTGHHLIILTTSKSINYPNRKKYLSTKCNILFEKQYLKFYILILYKLADTYSIQEN